MDFTSHLCLSYTTSHHKPSGMGSGGQRTLVTFIAGLTTLAMLAAAISKADFSSKVSIAYKECLETKYWLDLLKDTGYISEERYETLFDTVDELARILFSILK